MALRKGNVHSNILSEAYSLPPSATPLSADLAVSAVRATKPRRYLDVPLVFSPRTFNMARMGGKLLRRGAARCPRVEKQASLSFYLTNAHFDFYTQISLGNLTH